MEKEVKNQNQDNGGQQIKNKKARRPESGSNSNSESGITTITNSKNKRNRRNRSESLLGMDKSETTTINLNDSNSGIRTTTPDGTNIEAKNSRCGSSEKTSNTRIQNGGNNRDVQCSIPSNRENNRSEHTGKTIGNQKLSKTNYLKLDSYIGGGVWSILKSGNEWILSDGLVTIKTNPNIYFKDFLESDSILVGFEEDINELKKLKPKTGIVNLTEHVKFLKLKSDLTELINYFELTTKEAMAIMEIHSCLVMMGLRLKPNK